MAMIFNGERTSGMDIRKENVQAAVSVANIVRTSLGPVGLDKMMVDDTGEVTITNDGATILKLLDVEHPAAKVLVELADLQDQEIGDGTTSVVIVAAELLKVAAQLVREKIHPTSIISGFRIAQKEAVKYMQDNLTISTDDLGKDAIINVAKTSMSSKIIGPDMNFFAEMVVDAMMAVKRVNSKGVSKYSVRSVNILKAHGGSAKESRFINGYALNMTVSSQLMLKQVHGAKQKLGACGWCGCWPCLALLAASPWPRGRSRPSSRTTIARSSSASRKVTTRSSPRSPGCKWTTGTARRIARRATAPRRAASATWTSCRRTRSSPRTCPSAP